MLSLYGGNITLKLVGEPGIGKSSLLPAKAEDNGDKWRKPGDYYADDKYNYLYIDCPNEEIGDRKMKIPVHATKSLEDYISSEFRLSEGKPLYIMLDEFDKCPKALQVLFARMILERTIGNNPLPPGSVIFCTSNNATDGLGDASKGHNINRVMVVHVRKANNKEMAAYAISKGADRALVAWIAATKQAFNCSYLDGNQQTNPYIFTPNRTGPFVSGRSTMACDPIIKKRHLTTPRITMAALTGTIGAAGARSLMACVDLDDKIAKTEDIIKAPTAITVPDDPLAQILMMIHGASDVETQDEVEAFMQFVERVPSSEVQSIFFYMMVSSENVGKVILVRNNARLTKWRKDNYELI
jgi:hypothetical protein